MKPCFIEFENPLSRPESFWEGKKILGGKKVKIQLKPNELTKINVWVNEPPRALLLGPPLQKMELPGSRDCPSRTVTIEWSQPMGAFVCYGLLGATFTHQPTGTLVTTIRTTSSSETYESDIARKNISFPETGVDEYAPAIMEAIGHFPSEHHLLPNGALMMNDGASCPIGSSPRLFKSLTHFLLQLITWEGVLEESNLSQFAESVAREVSCLRKT